MTLVKGQTFYFLFCTKGSLIACVFYTRYVIQTPFGMRHLSQESASSFILALTKILHFLSHVSLCLVCRFYSVIRAWVAFSVIHQIIWKPLCRTRKWRNGMEWYFCFCYFFLQFEAKMCIPSRFNVFPIQKPLNDAVGMATILHASWGHRTLVWDG